MVQRYRVMHDKQKVLVFDDRPGVLRSTAAPPPGYTAPPHPFVNAQALDPGLEDALAGLLGQASTVAEFIALLEGQGFVVEADEA